MDRNTIVRIAIPLSLYESVKGKVLSESIHENDDYSKYEWLTDNLQEALYEYISEGNYRQGDEEQLKSDVDSAISKLVDEYIKRKLKPADINEAKKPVDAAKKKAEAKKAADKKAADIKKKKEADAKKVEAEKKKAAKAKKKVNESSNFDYENGNQGSGSQSQIQKGKTISINSIKPNMNIIVTWDEGGLSQGSGSDGSRTLRGIVKSIDDTNLYLEIPSDKLYNYKTSIQAKLKKTGLPIKLDSIKKVTTI